MKRYDYLIVGTGLFGAVCACLLMRKGKSCLMIDKRPHVGGNVFTEKINDIDIHRYGAHIFHTNNKEVWDFVNSFVEFNRYTNSPVANYKGELYNLPFNMNTFYQMWGVKTPDEARRKIDEQRQSALKALNGAEPSSLEEQALLLVGKDVYEKLIKGYTEKQWGRRCVDLPAFIIRRIPLRFTFDNNYFSDKYQGVPESGYTELVEKLIEGADVRLSCDYFYNKQEFDSMAERVIYTGEIDKYFGYCYGALQYRTVRFETSLMEGVDNYQGNAVINYTDSDTPYTRIIEHKHFVFGKQPDTIISKEYSTEWSVGEEPYYPVNDDRNNSLYEKYKGLAAKEENTFFGGRLAQYKYYDMDKVIEQAFSMVERLS